MKKDSKLIICYAILLIFIVSLIFTNYINPIDQYVYQFIQTETLAFRLHNYLSIISFLFSPLHSGILICVLLIGLYFYNRRNLLQYLIFSFSSLFIGTALKYIIQRPRPSDLIDGYSFPSMHTLTLFVAIFLILALYNHVTVKWITAILILSMMCSRIYLSAHFFSDTVASLIIVHLVYLSVAKFMHQYSRS
ncbi:phosphatase PAP2 family protein [Mammaliicoccus sciuri]|uniref:phosphatase PAP2 family protein n=1 Tax=Mammaliicoccus sciuri TaxID=1296 RepID=UPI001E384599|nr:phosphatase PAP2 family protein [Mammaliicoccus sciuri]MCD8796883.1 phosphatase PAP2 family protein [Mammaliicoccus sciuri]